MKRTGIINAQLSRVIAELGHGDLLVIADAGLPVPLGVERIDLALIEGVPSFVQTLEAILAEVDVEGVTLGAEMVDGNPQAHALVLDRLALVPKYLPHTEFKTLTLRARAIVRTGECSPFSNVILHSGLHAGFRRAASTGGTS